MNKFAIIAVALLFHTTLLSQQSPWEAMNRGLMHTLVYTIEIDANDPLRMYCGTDYGNIYTSTDGGFNWMLTRVGIPEDYDNERVSALHIDRTNAEILYTGFGGRESRYNLFMSTNAGAAWQVLATPSEWKKHGVLHILRNNTDPPRLFCGLGWFHGIFYSVENDSVWTRILGDHGIQVLTSHPGNASYLYAGASAGLALLRSTDGGDTWSQSTNGIDVKDKDTGVRCISCSPSNPSVVYAGVTGHSHGLYRSTNAGASWQPLNNVAEISEIAIHPKNENLIYISAIGTGVWRSTDGGANWTKLTLGLPTTDVMRVRFAPGYPVRVFAVTLKHGIYRMVDEELPECMFE